MDSVTLSFGLSKKGLPMYTCTIPCSDGMLVAKQEYLKEDFLDELFQRPSLINEDALRPFLKHLAEKHGKKWKDEAMKSFKKASQKTLLALKRASHIFLTDKILSNIVNSDSPEDDWKKVYFFWFFNRLIEKPEQPEIKLYLADWLCLRPWHLLSQLKKRLESTQNEQEILSLMESFTKSVEEVLESFERVEDETTVGQYELGELISKFKSGRHRLDKGFINKIERLLARAIPLNKKMPIYRIAAGLSTKDKVEAIRRWHYRHEQAKEKYVRKERTKGNTTVVELRPVLKGKPGDSIGRGTTKFLKFRHGR